MDSSFDAASGFGPMITPAPNPTTVQHSLLKRQSGVNRICGYESGLQVSQTVCNDGQICVDYSSSFRDCCNPEDCSIPTTCFGIAEASACAPSCLEAQTYFCQYIDAPYCVTLLYTDVPETPLTAFRCGVIPSMTFSFATTFSGISDSTSSSASDVTTRGSEEPSSTATSVTGTSGEDTLSSTDSPQEAPSSSGLSAGATAAIAVCISIVGLALIGFAFWFLQKRRKTNKVTHAQPPPYGTELTDQPIRFRDGSDFNNPMIDQTGTSFLQKQPLGDQR